jgi:hypothetical protein
MSDDKRPKEVSPELKRAVNRRSLITDELSRVTLQAAKQFPRFAGLLGVAARETPAQRDERLVRYLWQLLMGRDPKPHESGAGLDLVRAAQTVDEKGDALTDILWALCQTAEFEELKRPNNVLVRGLYKIALDRDPTDEEKRAAMEVLAEAPEHEARVAALEGLFTGLIRASESVLRRA